MQLKNLCKNDIYNELSRFMKKLQKVTKTIESYTLQ